MLGIKQKKLRLFWQKYLPWVVSLVLISIFFILFIDDWIGRLTDAGPTYFFAQNMNPVEQRQLPPMLQPVAEDDFWWLFLHFPADQQDYFRLFLPLMIVAILCLSLRLIPSNNRSRLCIKGILLLLGGRYFYWRTLATINNQTHWLSTIFASAVWAVELVAFASFILYTLQTIRTTTKNRRTEANRLSSPVERRDYLPPVDIFIPTHNESPYIVRRTVAGCQAINYDNKTIYILDDGKPGDIKSKASSSSEGGAPTGRPEIRELAQKMRCEYIAHPTNKKRKAGNLNNALKKTSGEFIAVMDADFVPFTNFLTRTVGFFRNNDHVYMIQTPQDFYNPDCHARNLGLGHFLPNDMEHFYGLLQPNRDSCNSVICCGSSYVVRRKSLEEIGGYYEDCCVEDFQTSLKLLTHKGNRDNNSSAIYLNETLSRGESPRSFSAFINQRLRWLQGNIEVYFREDLPIWTNLDWKQRSFMVSLAIYCIHPVIRVVFLITPLLSIYSGIAPVLAPFHEACYYFLPFWLLLIVVYGWASEYRVNYFWNECYETIFCFSALVQLFNMAVRGATLNKGVTAKGIAKPSAANTWKIIAPLVFLLVCTAAVVLLRYVGLYHRWWPRLNDHTVPLSFWLGYNTLFMLLAVLSAFDHQENRKGDRFPLQTPCKITPIVSDSSISADLPYMGTTKNVSEGGALLTLDDDGGFQEGMSLRVELPEEKTLEGFVAKAVIRRRIANSDRVDLAIQFSDLPLYGYRRLIKLLYCMGDRWWHGRKQPGLTDSVLALLSPLIGYRLPPINSPKQ
ncbi:MAG: glycosyltransferase [Symploca sp. SIO2G7]|nr:glycosyltransferase [Symploca sp. SIO2G7]